MKDKYFVYDPEDGFSTFPTLKEAKECATELLAEYRDSSHDEGWYEDIDKLCWGEIKQRAVEHTGSAAKGTNPYHTDYMLTDVEPKEISVDAAALGRVLKALIGPPHLIQELLVIRGLPGSDSDITKLIDRYNLAVPQG